MDEGRIRRAQWSTCTRTEDFLVLPVGQASHLELIVDIRTIALELAAHPKVLFVIPDAAGEMGSDKCTARGANRAVADQDVLVGNPVCADTENAAMLSVNEGVLVQHSRRPQAV